MDSRSHREQLYEAFSGSDAAVEDQIATGIEVATSRLGLPIGFLTEISDGTQRIVQATGDHELIQAGKRCPLDDAYCRRTIETEGPLAVEHASASAEVAERAFETFGLETYVGANVHVDGEVSGTVCFADTDERAEPFAEAETMFVELLARLAGEALERRERARERRRRTEQLRTEKRRFEGIAEASTDIIFRVDRDGAFSYVSAAVERVLGHDPETLVGAPFVEFVADDDAGDAMAAYGTVLDGDPVEAVEMDFRAADGVSADGGVATDVTGSLAASAGEKAVGAGNGDGHTVTLEVNATPITDDGEVVGVQGIGRDVTARKERTAELRLKNRAIDEADIGITIADATRPNNPIAYANEGFERLTGYDRSTIVGRNCRFLQGPATDADAVADLRAGVDAAAPTTVELVNYRADGTPFWSQVRISPVTNEDGDVTRFLGFQTDVTERKRTAQLVRLLNRVFRHNLRNEMTTLGGLGNHLADGGSGDGDADTSAAVGERVAAAAERVTDLSERARELERYARRDRKPARLDLAALLDSVAGRFGDEFPAATVETRVETDRGVCAGPEVKRALAELVENALKHHAGEAPQVALAAEDDGGWVEITVTDDGPGIDEMEAAVIAAGEETALEHSSGLGLWLVNWIATRYGGSCQIGARPDGAGTVATLRLPAIVADESVHEVARRPTVLFR